MPELGRLGSARSSIGAGVGRPGPIHPISVAVAGQLPRHRRGRSVQPPGQRADGLTARPTQRDLLPLGEGQVPPGQVSVATWANPAGLTHPGQPTLAVGPCHRGSVSHELTRLPRRPERLKQLSNKLLREPHHRHPHDLECCDHRKDPGFPLREGRMVVPGADPDRPRLPGGGDRVRLVTASRCWWQPS